MVTHTHTDTAAHTHDEPLVVAALLEYHVIFVVRVCLVEQFIALS